MLDQPAEVDQGTVDLVALEGGGWVWQKPDGSRTPLRGDVRFEGVSFGYETDQPILKGIDLFAKPGQKIAFVGPPARVKPPLPT